MRLVFALLLLPALCFAQPSITGVSCPSGYEHGNTITLSSSGSSFGTKVVVSPLAFDTIETGSFSDSWTNTFSLSVVDTSRHARSAYCGFKNFQADSMSMVHYNPGRYGAVGNSVQSEYRFCSYWFKLDENWDWGTVPTDGADGCNLVNVKTMRFWSSCTSSDNISTGTRNAQFLPRWVIEYVNVPDQDGDWSTSRTNEWDDGQWHHIQYAIKDSDANWAANAELHVWFDGHLEVDETGLVGRDNCDCNKYLFVLGFYNSWLDNSSDPNYFYFDDAYDDSTWARVEIGDDPVYADCSHREMQLLDAWAPDEVSFVMNQGSFSAGDAAYIFISDRDGNVNTTGWGIKVGGTPSVELTAPTNLTATGGN